MVLADQLNNRIDTALNINQKRHPFGCLFIFNQLLTIYAFYFLFSLASLMIQGR